MNLMLSLGANVFRHYKVQMYLKGYWPCQPLQHQRKSKPLGRILKAALHVHLNIHHL